jgi:hypothetical protein
MVVFSHMSAMSYDIPHNLPVPHNTYSQQHIEGLAGIDRRILCAPTAFYRLADRMGYDIELPDYVTMIRQELDKSSSDDGWNRARLSKTIREQWDVSNVSCWTKSLGSPVSHEGITNMQAAGYVSESPLEVAFLTEVMSNVSEGKKGVIDLIKMGIPLVTTVEPGFATNKAKHAVVLEGFDEKTGSVSVFDPDERNSESSYSVEWVENHLSSDGGVTVILPPQETPSQKYAA